MIARIVAVAAVALLATTPVASARADVPDADDHAAMAAMYSREAEALRRKAAEHELMLHRYENAASLGKGIPFPRVALTGHCRKLVAAYQEAASSAEALAKAEAELARTSP